nr:carboxylesterase family protein [Pectobacterium colocasium]
MDKKITASLILLIAAVSQPALANDPLVTLDSGRISGTETQGVDAFKGIPFAAPPIGELRWQPPQPVQSWNDIRSSNGIRQGLYAESFSRRCRAARRGV